VPCLPEPPVPELALLDLLGVVRHSGEWTAVTSANAARLYNGGELPPPADPPGEHQSLERWNEDHMAPAVALAEALRGT